MKNAVSDISVWIVGVLAAVAAVFTFLRASVKGAGKLQEFLDEWPDVLSALHEASESRERVEKAIEGLTSRVEEIEVKLECDGNRSLQEGGSIADSLLRLEAELHLIHAKFEEKR